MDDRDLREQRPETGDGGASDGVGRLIRLAGDRTVASEARKRRIHGAVEAHWRQELSRRTRPRGFRLTAGLAAAATVVVAIGIGLLKLASGPEAPPELASSRTAVAEIVVGSVLTTAVPEQNGAGVLDADAGSVVAMRPLSVGDGIAAGTRITTGTDGRAALRLADGESVRLDNGTRLAILQDGAFDLESGAVYVDSGIGEAGRPHVAIGTRLGLVRDIGTQFEARLDDESLRVRVREGTVNVRPSGGPDNTVEHTLDAGDEARLDSRGGVDLARIDPFAPDWAWMNEITPMLDLDGRTAREFLEWVARERGLELEFEDPDLEKRAAVTRVEGSIEGLSLDQALDAVLPTCGVVHDVREGHLVISVAP